MPTEPENFLLDKVDGLPIRSGALHTPRKLRAISEYFFMFNTALKDKPWAERYYIDLQSGPGKTTAGNSILLGSPLLALTCKEPFTQYRLNEKNLSLKTLYFLVLVLVRWQTA